MSARQPPPRRRVGAWLPILLLLGSIYVFWVLPAQLGERPVRADFGNDTAPTPSKP
ncbi:MAG: hypothetical protein KIS66_14620 [Fimbriimonadaceae bacterium]|nr:hypothetical protein [Fimbriimonadaceae bacterium]